ncbi:MAG: hypothetical protein ACLGIC_14350 [Acidimicrobiia bacterium]
MIATLGAALMMLGLFGVSQATADPGPNGNNDKGLCTAYFNGQKKGHDKNGSPPPFAALEEAADEANGDDEENEDPRLERAEDVFEFCNGMIGGNPSNGRFDCSETEGEITCEDGGGPGAEGKGKGKP